MTARLFKLRNSSDEIFTSSIYSRINPVRYILLRFTAGQAFLTCYFTVFEWRMTSIRKSPHLRQSKFEQEGKSPKMADDLIKFNAF